MTSVGQQLRSAREDQQRGIPEIAADLCIAPRYLLAIEEDNLADLPGLFFYKSFVKQYAAILHVDIARLQPGIDSLCPPSEEPAAGAPTPDGVSVATSAMFASAGGVVRAVARRAEPVRQPEPVLQDFNRYVSDRRIGVSAAALVVVVLVCSGFYSWWTKAPAVASQKAPVVDSNVASVAVPVAEARIVQHAELNVSATETTWLSITANGKEIFSGVLQPSQTKTLTGVEGAQIRVGNAGGIEVRWKGKPIGPFGPSGQVRTVQLTEDNFKIIAPEPERVSTDPAL